MKTSFTLHVCERLCVTIHTSSSNPVRSIDQMIPHALELSVTTRAKPGEGTDALTSLQPHPLTHSWLGDCTDKRM